MPWFPIKSSSVYDLLSALFTKWFQRTYISWMIYNAAPASFNIQPIIYFLRNRSQQYSVLEWHSRIHNFSLNLWQVERWAVQQFDFPPYISVFQLRMNWNCWNYSDFDWKTKIVVRGNLETQAESAELIVQLLVTVYVRKEGKMKLECWKFFFKFSAVFRVYTVIQKWWKIGYFLFYFANVRDLVNRRKHIRGTNSKNNST